MRKQTQIVVLGIAVIYLLAIGGCADVTTSGVGEPAIIPKPVKMEIRDGAFTLTPKTTIVVSNDTAGLGQYMAGLLAPATGFDLKVSKSAPEDKSVNCIVLRNISAEDRLGPEGYDLKVTRNRVFIEASTESGVFYGIQTLRQLLPAAIESRQKVDGVAWGIPQVEIEDRPRFPWRGFMLDSSRHFQTKEFVKRFIDLLAYHKMNRFHWHLTDNQGWRIEIKKHPKLTEVGAWRGEGENRYGGYYSQEDIKEVVAYAKSRHVMVIPEIEMPGHCIAALTAYPELSCTGGPFAVMTTWETAHDVFCAGNDQTFEVLEDVLSEVIELFDAPYIHVGGDECPKDRWQMCSKCQARIKNEGLKDEAHLQSWFMQRINNFLIERNRRSMAWADKNMEHGAGAGQIIQAWHSGEDEIAVKQMGHECVHSLNEYCYLNYYSSEEEINADPNYPFFWHKRVVSLPKVYSFEPVPAGCTAEQAKLLLGSEACLWTEYIPQEAIDRKVFPRLLSLIEVLWSPAEGRDFDEFYNRVQHHYKRLERLGVNYDRTPLSRQ